MEELTAKCLGPIWNARDLFLAGVMTENEIAIGSAFSAFDISLWQDEKRDDNALPLWLHCQENTSLPYTCRLFSQECALPEASRPRAIGQGPRLAGQLSLDRV